MVGWLVCLKNVKGISSAFFFNFAKTLAMGDQHEEKIVDSCGLRHTFRGVLVSLRSYVPFHRYTRPVMSMRRDIIHFQ